MYTSLGLIARKPTEIETAAIWNGSHDIVICDTDVKLCIVFTYVQRDMPIKYNLKVQLGSHMFFLSGSKVKYKKYNTVNIHNTNNRSKICKTDRSQTE